MTKSYVIYVLFYVDDMVITSSDPQQVRRLMDALKSEFQLHDLGKLSYFLGVQVRRGDRCLFLNQHRYLANLLRSTNLDHLRPSVTLMRQT